MFLLNIFDANLYLLAYPMLTVMRPEGHVMGRHDSSPCKPSTGAIMEPSPNFVTIYMYAYSSPSLDSALLKGNSCILLIFLSPLCSIALGT